MAILENGESLSHLFHSAQELHSSLKTKRNSVDAENQLLSCILEFNRVDKLVRAAAIFSRNELIDDVNTSDLKYLLVNYYLGDLHLKVMEKRYFMLKKSLAYLSMFKEIVHTLKVDQSYRNKDFEIPEGADKRTVKIMRFKAEKATSNRIKELLDAQNSRKYDDDGDSYHIVNEELERERWILVIQNMLRKAEDNIDVTNQELEILEHMQNQSSSFDGKINVASNDDRMQQKSATEDSDRNNGISVTKISPDFMITRETFKDGVFRPSHRLPTMTLEEFADIEIAEALEREKRQKDAPSRPLKYKELEEEGKEDDLELVNQATFRDRSWDDWKDDNPRGTGVTKRV